MRDVAQELRISTHPIQGSAECQRPCTETSVRESRPRISLPGDALFCDRLPTTTMLDVRET